MMVLFALAMASGVVFGFLASNQQITETQFRIRATAMVVSFVLAFFVYFT